VTTAPYFTLDGLIVANGLGNSLAITSRWGGGGLFAARGSVGTITNCTFTNNSTNRGTSGGSGHAGAICMDGMAAATPVSLTITDSTFSDNYAAAMKSMYGGAIGVAMSNQGGSLVVTNCTFLRNRVKSLGGNLGKGGQGGAISIVAAPMTYAITGCVFEENGGGEVADAATFSRKGDGGAIDMHNETAPPQALSGTITNCVFKNNGNPDGAGANGGGGAIANWGRYNSGVTQSIGLMKITNCVFIGNKNSQGAAISSGQGYSADIVNCTFAGNSWSTGLSLGGGAILRSRHQDPLNSDDTWGRDYIVNCLFSGNFTGDSAGDETINAEWYDRAPCKLVNCAFNDYPSTVGNDVVDGGVAAATIANNRYGKGYVLPTGAIGNIQSVAIDNGANSDTSATVPTTDIVGQAIVNTTKDIGAYEWVSTPTLTAYQSTLTVNYSTNLPFGSQLVASGTLYGVVVITNTGANPLVLDLGLDQGTVGSGSEFQLRWTTGTLSPLAPGASVAVGIDWTPTYVNNLQARNAKLMVSHTGTNLPSVYGFPLGGTALPVTLSVFRVE